MQKWDKHASKIKQGCTAMKCGKQRNNKHHAVANTGMFYVPGLNSLWEDEKKEELEYLEKYKDMIATGNKLDDEQQKHYDQVSRKHKVDVDLI